MADNRPTGADLIAAERTRQIAQEGYTPEHDALHDPETLASAALAYLTHPSDRPPLSSPRGWPWGPDSWKPSPNRVRELVKAGALVAAAIDALIAKETDRG